ncbi:uncharacterized protein LOC105248404 [Camponotus floridanus]|uniref:uncharacterized protein LOC105248404 n=1 Tax=Camponotus floridanus TaxID=104421 RepID=UPI000DC6C7BA|nr:uncharacterized protein LOC105248404 [Camponotus floridanus]
MIHLERESRFFKLNRILLLAIGLWPNQQTTFSRIQFFLFSIILLTSLLFQYTPLISQRCTPDFAKILSSATFFSLFVIKYILFSVNMENMKDLLEQLQLICNELKDENEFDIINEYECSATRLTAALTICSISGIFILAVTQFWSNILDIILPINASRPYYIPLQVEYFIDQEKYSSWILLHISVAFLVGIIAMVGIGTTIIAYLQYTCGMFKIASYRIELAMSNNMLQNSNVKNKFSILEGLIWAVDIHRQAMNLSTNIQLNIEPMVCCLIIFGVASMSLNMYQIFQIISADDISLYNVKELIIPLLYAIIIFLYMLLSNCIGQYITDHNRDIFVTVYNVQWYIAPLYIQKIILFLLQRKSRDFVLNYAGLFVISLEFFATLVKVSVSYFTVIYSVQ